MKQGARRASGAALLCLALAAWGLPACVQLGQAVSPLDDVLDTQRLRRVGLPREVGGVLDLGGRRGGGGVLPGRFEHAVYASTDAQTATVVMWSGEAENAEQAVVMRVLWTPRAGATPLDDFATNATVRWAIFAGGEAGLYSGAGFAYPYTSLGGRRLSMKLEQSDLRLSEASERFKDPFELAGAEGAFTARRDPDRVQTVLRTLHRRLREGLGRPALVDLGAAGPEMALAAPAGDR